MLTAAPSSLVYEGRIKIPYAWSAGQWGSYFLTQLKEKKIFGSRCPKCDKVFLPPKKNCGVCFSLCPEWVEVGPEGTLLAWTRVFYDSPLHPTQHPVYGLIRLQGADTALLHLVLGTQVNVGMKLRAVFKEERQGHILDLLGFEPSDG